MGHSSGKNMSAAVNAGTWVGCGVTPEEIKRVMKSYTCVVCELGKLNKMGSPPSVSDPKTYPIAQIISGDIVGPVSPKAGDGSKYIFLFVDRRTSYWHAFTAPTKDGFLTSLKQVYNFYKKHGHEIQVFRSDSENILVQGGVEEYLAEKEIAQDYSLPYAHYQNLVERHVQTMVKLIWNNTPNPKTEGSSPNQKITGKESPTDMNREFLFPFGQPVTVRIPKREWRFDLRSDLGIYIGTSAGSVNGGSVYYPSTKAILARAELVPLKITESEFSRYDNIRDMLKHKAVIITGPDNNGAVQEDDELVIPTIEQVSE